MAIYNYFVSFAHRNGFGNCCIGFRQPITTYDDIRYIEEVISSKDKTCKDIVVLNYQLLTKQTED